MNISYLFREGCSGLSSKPDIVGRSNKVNPVTLIIPHMKLETNNCNFLQIMQALEHIKYYDISGKGTEPKNNENIKIEIQNESSSGNNRSLQSTSIENSDSNHKRHRKTWSPKGRHENIKLNFLELFYHIQESKNLKSPLVKDLKSIITIENKEI